jgi:rRNA maturation endonuclease Nob1
MASAPLAEGHAMKLFKRTEIVDEAPRCPTCGERVPEGAESCAMCGHAFETRFSDRLSAGAGPAKADAPSGH